MKGILIASINGNVGAKISCAMSNVTTSDIDVHFAIDGRENVEQKGMGDRSSGTRKHRKTSVVDAVTDGSPNK